jgi:hypothetical protein
MNPTTPGPSDEITRFLNRQPGGSEPSLPDPYAPEVVFPGVLTLTREQEQVLVERCFRRREELELTLGLDRARMNETDYAASANLDDMRYFFGRRRLFELMYHKRMAWRPQAYGSGSIFATTNLHLPMVRRIVQQQIARASNYFFSTEPWFNASPQGPADEVLAQRINRFAQWKFRRGEVRPVLEQAIEKAMVRGECVVKTAAVRKSRFYEDVLTIAIDPATGEPLLANDGDYIQETDTWQAVTREELDPATGQPVIVPETREDGTPVMVLSRDPSTEMPDQELTYDTRVVTRERVLYGGPEASLVYFLDFLCPEDARSVQEADFCCHLYDMPATQIAQAYLDRGPDADPNQRTKMLELLRRVAGARIAQPAAAAGVRPEDGGDVASEAYLDQMAAGRIPIMECYLTADVNDDGRPEEVMVLLDRETRKPIFYDYLDRITPDGKRPFHVVRVNPVDGRWYGTSQVDLFWDLQMFVDLTMNRWNFSQSNSARVDFWSPDAVLEGDGNPHLRLNAGRTYRLKPGKTAEDALQSKYLTDIKGADLQNQIEFFLQIATTMSGVTSANDAAMANLDTTKLATGVRNIEKSGQELFAPLISHLEPGLASVCESLLALLVFGMDGPEIYQYFEGETRIEEIRPDDLRGIEFLVEMELTRYKTEQELQQSLHALDVIDRYFTLIPELQTATASIYQNILKLFGIDHSDRIIVPGLVAPPSANTIDPAGAAAAIQPKPTGKSEPNL